MKRIVVDVDDRLHRDFKVYCYSKEKTIREVIVELIESKVKKKSAGKVRRK